MRVRAADATTGRDTPTDGGSDVHVPRDDAARIALGAVIVLAAVVLLVGVRAFWFGGDDWYIITDRGLTAGPGHDGLFEPHFEHWSTVPILVFRALYSTFGLRTFWPYIGLTIIVHLAIVVLLWIVMVRSRIDAWVATCACAVFAVPGSGFENVTNAWQTQLISPLALGLAAILVAPESGGRFTRRDAIAAALLSVAVVCSGVALPMLVTVALIALIRRGWRIAALTVAVPTVLYGWWYVAYGRSAPRVADPAPGAVPGFVWRGFTDALGDIARVEVAGTIVVLATIAWVTVRLVRRHDAAQLTVPVALAVGAIVFLAATGYRRANLFRADPAVSRYAYVTVVFVLPLLALASQNLFRGKNWKRVLLGVLTVALVVGQVRQFHRETDAWRPAKQEARGAVLATAALAREGRTFLFSSPLSIFEPQVTVNEIAAMDADGKLPPVAKATKKDLLTVLARLDLAIGPEPLIAPRVVARVLRTRNVDLTPAGDGCLAARARRANEVVFRLDAPGTFRVDGEGTLGLRLREPSGGVDGTVMYFHLPGGREQVVTVAAAENLVVVSLPSEGPTLLCDVLQ